MKKLFSLILIGLFMLTVIPAKATVLEKNKSEIVQSFSILQSDDSVILPLKAVSVTTQNLANYKSVNFPENSNKNFITIFDVGWKNYQSIYNSNSSTNDNNLQPTVNGISTEDEDIGCWWCNACRGCGTLPPPPPPPYIK